MDLKRLNEQLDSISKINEMSDDLLQTKEAQRLALIQQLKDLDTDFDVKPSKKSESVELPSKDTKFNYMMLSRLQMDCEYFLGNGHGCENHLWAGNVQEQIAKMKKLYNALEEKPEWISMEDIENYEQQMTSLLARKNESIINEISDNLADAVNDQRHADAAKAGENAIASFVHSKIGWEKDANDLYKKGLKAKRSDDLYKARRFRQEFPDGTMSREEAEEAKDRAQAELEMGRPLKHWRLGVKKPQEVKVPVEVAYYLQYADDSQLDKATKDKADKLYGDKQITCKGDELFDELTSDFGFASKATTIIVENVTTAKHK